MSINYDKLLSKAEVLMNKEEKCHISRILTRIKDPLKIIYHI